MFKFFVGTAKWLSNKVAFFKPDSPSSISKTP